MGTSRSRLSKITSGSPSNAFLRRAEEEADDERIKRSYDRAIASFVEAYADQTERDHAALPGTAQAGRIPIETGVKFR